MRASKGRTLQQKYRLTGLVDVLEPADVIDPHVDRLPLPGARCTRSR